MKAATASIDEAIAKRLLWPIERDAIIAKMKAHWDEAANIDWYLGKSEAN